MTKTKDKIIKNHIEQLKKQIIKLKYKGFVLTPNKEIYQYNIFNDNFNKIELETFYKILCSGMPFNYWDIQPEQNQEYINKILFEMDILPIINNRDLINYNQYKKAKQYLSIESNQMSKRGLNKILKENEQKKKDMDKITFEDTKSQSQILINNNIFTNKNSSFFQWNEQYNYFDIMEPGDLINVICGSENKELNNKLYNAYSVFKHDYNKYLTWCNCRKWNEYQFQEKILNENKTSYKTVKKIIKDFE